MLKRNRGRKSRPIRVTEDVLDALRAIRDLYVAAGEERPSWSVCVKHVIREHFRLTEQLQTLREELPGAFLEQRRQTAMLIGHAIAEARGVPKGEHFDMRVAPDGMAVHVYIHGREIVFNIAVALQNVARHSEALRDMAAEDMPDVPEDVVLH